MKKLPLILLTLLLTGVSACFAQSVSPQVIGSAGDYYTGPTTSVGWTVGESAVATISNSTNTVTQGFHQPTYSVVAVDPDLESNYEIKVYPNPASNTIFFELNREDQAPLQVDLVDVQGQILGRQSTTQKEDLLQFDLSQMAAGHYFLRALQPDGQSVKSFKILKVR
ncbi:MAG: T9SS type A sorting domain-containing protein [Bacteroidia bacterium]|nr:T9SS type A sorting domain-containing protein [Bacteroidia bacterium]